MVNIRELIGREKERFKDYRASMTKQRLEKETRTLEAERIRQGEIAKLQREKQAVKRDVQNIRQYNEQIEGPSKLQKFGTGLSSAINKAKELKPKNKISLRSRKTSKKSDVSRLGMINRGSSGIQLGGTGSGLNFGGSDNSPFSFNNNQQPKKEIKREKPINIKINK